MELTKVSKLINVTLAAFILFGVKAYASEQPNQTISIEDSSVNWEDVAARERLLGAVPKWSPAVIKSMYEDYQHPERHHLPSIINGDPVNYNALFINALWGPRDNPFVKFPRPAKVFLFIQNSDPAKRYFMAPVIQDENDRTYYVFDKSLTQPMVLKDWVANKASSYCSTCAVRFNICTGYGNLPQDTCEGKNYESEIYDYPQDGIKGDAKLFPSAIRKPNQDWREKIKKRSIKDGSDITVLDGSAPWLDMEKRKALLNSAAVWPNYQAIKSNFEKIRNLRYFSDEVVPNFGRRISWLYPDDGCWTRVGAVVKDFFGPMNNLVSTYQRPSKVFAFGNLCVNTTNSPNGKVSWWYHTAPIIRDAETNQTYVLDPSVNPAAPTPVEQWMDTIAAKTGNCANESASVSKFNICSGYGVSPYDNCELTLVENFEVEIRAFLLQRYFRRFERDRQIELGRDPTKVLGDSPPWLSTDVR